jgi:hypothetical protein
MKRYLLDSSIMGDFIDHRRCVPEKVREAQQRGSRIGTGMPRRRRTVLRDGVQRHARREPAAAAARANPNCLLAPRPSGRRGLRPCGRRVTADSPQNADRRHHGCGNRTGAWRLHGGVDGQRPRGGARAGGRELGGLSAAREKRDAPSAGPPTAAARHSVFQAGFLKVAKATLDTDRLIRACCEMTCDCEAICVPLSSPFPASPFPAPLSCPTTTTRQRQCSVPTVIGGPESGVA